MQNKDNKTQKESDLQNSKDVSNGKSSNDKKQDTMLQEEIEIDTNGKETIVKRAHNAADGERSHIPTEDRTWNENG
jgi:23S rRNA maturation mini-RNase III